MTLHEEHRQQLLLAALSDRNSPVYKNLNNICRESSAAFLRAKMVKGEVLIPFHIDQADQSELEAQFGVAIKVRGVGMRMIATPRVAGMSHLIDMALAEFSFGSGRKTLFVDGDLMTMVTAGLENKLIERTNALPRLAAGYFIEDDQLRTFASVRAGIVNRAADIVLSELRDGGGEHFHPVLREKGPAVNSIVINHFKTPVGPRQAAWLAHCRGAVVYGAIFFQPEMLVKDEGELRCFPGRYYIDRKLDSITLVPASDATMSISHYYSDWYDLVTNNVVTVGGREYLCEKFKSVLGVLYYTLVRVGADFETPEVLRTNYFDKTQLALTRVSFPKVRLSSEGVPVGYETGSLLINSTRLDSVLSRAMCSVNDIVKPSEVFSILMDHNNTSVVSLDHTKVPDRMDVDDENQLALAIALHVNWHRHQMRSTLKALVGAVKLRYSMATESVNKFAYIALCAWWSKPRVSGSNEEALPVAKVLDWCGNDFSVVMEDADPWIEFVQCSGRKLEFDSIDHPWFPKTPRKPGWVEALVAKASKAMGVDECFGLDDPEFQEVIAQQPKFNDAISATLQRVYGRGKEHYGYAVVDRGEQLMEKPRHDLTNAKLALKKKMQVDQGAIDERVPDAFKQIFQEAQLPEIASIPVVDVEPISAMEEDILMCNKGPLERDVVATGYRIAEVDIHANNQGSMSVNDSKREIPAPRWARKPVVDAGSEGKRVSSQAALIAAVRKRNIGVPANRGIVDLDKFPVHAVDSIITTCYRDDWQDVVQRHLNAGMWQANSSDIEDFLANIEEKKVKQLLDEFFLEGTVDLGRWQLMAKGKIKSGREPGSTKKVDHSQTILYLENASTNAMYSSMMRRFKECMNECLRPNVSVASDHSDEEHENWYNSLETFRKSFDRTTSYDVDMRCYDRAQDAATLRLDLEWYKRHGLNKDTLEIWSRTHGVKRAMSMMFGVIIFIVLEGVSGLWKTLMRNSVINLAALVVGARITRSNLVMIDIKGDDADIEVATPLNVAQAMEDMGLIMNLSAKFHTNHIRYMCKQFRLKIGERWFFVADPYARVQSVCTVQWIGNHEDSLRERWVSLRNELRHYDNGIVVDAVAEACQQHYGLSRPLYGMARALSKIRSSFDQYARLFRPAQLIS